MTTIPHDRPDWRAPVDAVSDQLYYTGSLGVVLPINQDVKVGKSYQALAFQMATGGGAEVLTIEVISIDSGGNFIQDTTYTRSGGGGLVDYFTVPIALTAGGTFRLIVSSSRAGASVTMVVFGLTVPIVSSAILVRSDGRPYPVGALSANGSTIGGGTLIAAPGAGKRIMLASLLMGMVDGPGGSGALQITGTVGGSLVALGYNGGTAANNAVGYNTNPIPPQGVLLDDNTALTYSTAGAPATITVNALYDVVP